MELFSKQLLYAGNRNYKTQVQLEISGNNIIVKTGSKVYVPSGTTVFNQVTIASDITINSSKTISSYVSGTDYYILINNTGTDGILVKTTGEMSTETNWTTTSTIDLRYNTVDNYIKYTTNTGSTWSNNYYSFPIANVTL